MRGPYVAPGMEPGDLSAVLDHLSEFHPQENAILWIADYGLADLLGSRGIPTWLGGAYIPFDGVYPATRYYEGMINDDWRWRAITESVAAARQALNVINPVGWYITEENDLKGLAANFALRERMRWFLIELMRQLYSLRQLRFLWSPWGSGSPTAAAVNAARDTLVLARDFLRGQGLPIQVELHLQDGVGAGHHTKEVAASWGQALKVLSCPTAMNMEVFKLAEGKLVPGDRTEIVTRETFYQSKGLVIGGMWAERYWYHRAGWISNHAGV